MNAATEMSLIGRKKAGPLVVLGHRELEPGEIELLLEERGVQKPAPLKRIAARHHALARMIAGGTPHGEAAIMVGYTASRVSILISDPTFAELVAHYTKNIEAVSLGVTTKMEALHEDAVDLLQDRMDTEPDKITTAEALQIQNAMADRTGHGVSTKAEVNVKVGLAERLAEAAERVRVSRGAVVDATVVEAPTGG